MTMLRLTIFFLPLLLCSFGVEAVQGESEVVVWEVAHSDKGGGWMDGWMGGLNADARRFGGNGWRERRGVNINPCGRYGVGTVGLFEQILGPAEVYIAFLILSFSFRSFCQGKIRTPYGVETGQFGNENLRKARDVDGSISKSNSPVATKQSPSASTSYWG
jgi:hypothetical protein